MQSNSLRTKATHSKKLGVHLSCKGVQWDGTQALRGNLKMLGFSDKPGFALSFTHFTVLYL